jgi:hypothetical protein
MVTQVYGPCRPRCRKVAPRPPTIVLCWHRWSDTVGGCLLVAAVC